MTDSVIAKKIREEVNETLIESRRKKRRLLLKMTVQVTGPARFVAFIGLILFLISEGWVCLIGDSLRPRDCLLSERASAAAYIPN